MARTTKRWRLLSLFLAVLMVVSALPLATIGAFAADADASSGGKTTDATTTDVRAVLLDCGRKYFSPKSIKKLIDHMAEYKYNQLQLAFGNGGCRFLLDDMSLSFSGVNLTSDAVTNDIIAGNKNFWNSSYSDDKDAEESAKYLTQDEMTDIIAYANDKGIEIVPMLNMPNHATAIANVNDGAYKDSNGKIDVSNETARAYAVALLKKYAEYFKDRGCKTFSFGADESGFTGTSMDNFVDECYEAIKKVGMKARAFNDATGADGVTFDSNIEISFGLRISGTHLTASLRVRWTPPVTISSIRMVDGTM